MLQYISHKSEINGGNNSGVQEDRLKLYERNLMTPRKLRHDRLVIIVYFFGKPVYIIVLGDFTHLIN